MPGGDSSPSRQEITGTPKGCHRTASAATPDPPRVATCETGLRSRGIPVAGSCQARDAGHLLTQCRLPSRLMASCPLCYGSPCLGRTAHSSRGPGRRPLTPVTRVRIPYALPPPDVPQSSTATTAANCPQDALLALVTSWADIREPGVWLIGTVRLLCRAYVRRQRRSKIVGVDLEQLEWLAGAAPSGEGQHGARRDLERLVRELTPPQRRLLRLSFGLGLDARELARQLGGAKPESLRQARRRAITRLRELMAVER